MPQSFSNNNQHIIFSTKDRYAFFRDKKLRVEVFHYLAGVTKKLDCQAILMGGHIDHVHLLVSLSRTITIADYVKEVKRSSNIWLKSKGGILEKFAWQHGYAGFSVSQSNVGAVANYIQRQEELHSKHQFKDEYLSFLKKHQIEWDERYVWD